MNRATIGQCVLVMAICSSGQAQDVRLKYLAHYDPVSKEVLGVENVLDHHALISSAGALTLVDLNELQPGGAQKFIDSLMLPSVSSYTRADGYVYVNLRLGGLAVVRLNPLTMELSVLQEIDEPDVIFERMAIVGDRLYVAAHAYGLRIFDITDPALPALVGSLPSGFDDAFAVAVSGNTAYVADGAGGLKIVDITVEAAPRILEGENPESAAGTSQDVMVIDDHVYVAAGGAGVAVYDPGTVAGRTVYDTPVAAQQLARVGSYLAIADLGGVQVFAIETDGSLTPAASELAMRRMRDTGAYTT
ncbi:MAG: LVIVD repeat-containing protein, partial [Planctomycetota bacterium]